MTNPEFDATPNADAVERFLKARRDRGELTEQELVRETVSNIDNIASMVYRRISREHPYLSRVEGFYNLIGLRHDIPSFELWVGISPRFKGLQDPTFGSRIELNYSLASPELKVNVHSDEESKAEVRQFAWRQGRLPNSLSTRYRFGRDGSILKTIFIPSEVQSHRRDILGTNGDWKRVQSIMTPNDWDMARTALETMTDVGNRVPERRDEKLFLSALRSIPTHT